MAGDAGESRDWAFRLEQAAQVFLGSRLIFILCLVIGAAASVAMGQDANFDLKNYHLYIAYALLNSRLHVDLMPAALGTFLNPLLDIPYYLFAVSLLPTYPRWVAAIQGFFFGLVIYLTLRINMRVFAERGALPVLKAVIATAIGVTGAATVAQIGTTFNDTQIAALLLAGLLLLLPRALNSERERLAGLRPLWAGVAFGAAAGLKLTAVLLAPGAGVAIVSVAASMRSAASRLLLFVAGWIAGFAAFAGFWTWQMYAMTGSPMFPFFNRWFRSHWFPPANIADERWGPKTIFDAILFPFAWARRNHGTVTEMPFRDPRFTAAWLAVMVIGAAAIWFAATRSEARGSIREALPLTPSARMVLAFTVASYVAWLLVMPVLRYAVSIEVLTGTLVVLAAELVVAAFLPVPRRSLVTLGSACIITIVLIASTRYPNWGRVPFAERTFAVTVPEIPPGSLVIVDGHSLSYVIPFMRSDNTSFVGVNGLTVAVRGYRLFDETRRRIGGHTGPLFVLTAAQHRSYRHLIGEFGVAWNDDACRPIISNLDDNLLLCVASPRTMPRAQPVIR